VAYGNFTRNDKGVRGLFGEDFCMTGMRSAR
jgi:hypothetical protein